MMNNNPDSQLEEDDEPDSPESAPPSVTVNNENGPITTKPTKKNNPIGETFQRKSLKRVREDESERISKNIRLRAKNAHYNL
jgi:hypothetical protein